METRITCQQFFDGDQLHNSTSLVLRDGVITDIQSFNGKPDFSLVTPGFVDLQVNGLESHHVSLSSTIELRQLDALLRTKGTTTWLATLVTAPLDTLSQQIDTISQAIDSETMPGCAGIHVEGPFLGASTGAHNKSWVVSPDVAWISQTSPTVKLMTLAPEHELAPLAIESLVSRGMKASLGHTAGSRDQFKECVSAGANMVTHLFNGMSGIHHRDGGIALWSLLHPEITTCLIPDLVHVSPDILALTFALKPSQQVVFVSDAIGWNHPQLQNQGVHVSHGVAQLANGTIAGSCITLADGVRISVQSGAITLEQALRAATSAPADAMGWSHVGRAHVGDKARLNILDSDLRVVETLC